MNKDKILLLYLLLITTSFLGCANTKDMTNKHTVKELDIDRYLGTWYEIARYDHRFERGLVGVTATYSLKEDGKIKVVNSGFKNTLDGKKSIAIGKAKIPNPQDKAKLKVSFFWIFYGDYFVMELDTDYQWAVIGSSSDNYLWILSRTPFIDNNVYDNILTKVKNRGYDISKLIKVEQKEIIN